MSLSSLLSLPLLVACGLAAAQTPWPSQYNIKPWETNRLTAADVVGPDGIVYPDWTGVGVEGGIPALDLSGNPADGVIITNGGYYYRVCRVAGSGNSDVSTALTAATNYANGGTQRAIVYFPAGTYTLSQQFTIYESGIVVAGAGTNATTCKIGTGGSGALFKFQGGSWGGTYQTANENISRGAANARFGSVSGYSSGMWVRIVPTDASSPNDTMRKRYSKPELGVVFDNAWDHLGRVFYARITAISGTRVYFDRTFPHDLFTDESPQMRTAVPVEYCGLQDLTIETTSGSYSLEPVCLYSAANCWVKNVRFVKADNWPIASASEGRIRCEIRNCNFEGTWADLNDGGNAYLGWTQADFDCLMDNCTGNGLRHMAIFQKAMRCVVRNCTFTGTHVRSPQHHGRLPLDNLIEGTTFNASGGEAFYTDPCHSLTHGPNGPRNVYYNNRVLTGSAVMQLMGAQEAPILVYNKIVRTDTSAYKPAVWAFDRSFDGILRGNCIQVQTQAPVINFEDTTCPGWEVCDNNIYGSNRALWAGDSAPAAFANNRLFAYGTPADTSPEVASIYDWQKNYATTQRLALVIANRVMAESGAAAARVVRVKAATGSSLVVTLNASSGAATVPASVTIPAGAVYADFVITGQPVSGGEQTVTITATAPGLLADTEQVFVLDAGAAQPVFCTAALDICPTNLPANWHAADFGRVATNGSAVFNSTNDTWTLRGAGIAQPTGYTLAHGGRRFVFQSVVSNGEIRARLVSTSGDNQVGLMIADDAAPITEFITVEPSGRVLSSGYAWDYHANANQYVAAGTKTVPIWLRLRRDGTNFFAYKSTVAYPSSEGDWTTITMLNFYTNITGNYKSQSTLDDVMHFGMFVNSGSETTLAQAVFSNVVVTGTIMGSTTPPAWVSGWPTVDTSAVSSFIGRARIDKAGAAFYVALYDGSAAPSAAQVKAGQNASGNPAPASGSITLGANKEAAAAIIGLEGATHYDVYFVAEDTCANLQATPVKIDAATLVPEPALLGTLLMAWLWHARRQCTGRPLNDGLPRVL